MLDTHSLSATINAVNETYLFDEVISGPTAKKISDFIAGRQGLSHSYFGLFAPLDEEVKVPFRCSVENRSAQMPPASISWVRNPCGSSRCLGRHPQSCKALSIGRRRISDAG